MTSELTTRPAAKRTPSKAGRRKKTSPPSEATPIEAVRHALELMKPQLAAVLPEPLAADRLVRVVVSALRRTPALLDCDRASLYRAVTTCAQLGLEPDGVLGQAWLVPSRGKVQLVPGYRGLIALACNGGVIHSINAQAVHRNDHFDYAYGLNERLEHVPAAGDRGEITHFYAYARLKDGSHCFDVMSRSEVDAVRDRSDGYRAEASAWANGYTEMGKRTVLRRIAKYLPPAVQKAAALVDLHEAGKNVALDDLGEILVEPAAAAASSALETSRVERTPGPEPPPARLEPVPTAEPEAVALSEEELSALLPPLHILEILDAVAEREMPEEALEAIVGRPLEEVAEGDTRQILRAISLWRPAGS
jgi:recombination protein RecT